MEEAREPIKTDPETSLPGPPTVVVHCKDGSEVGYFRKLGNWVNILTLTFVGLYTGISFCTMQVGRDSFTSVQRAFVTVASLDSSVRYGSGFAKDTKYWWFAPNIKNSGNTPTQNLRYYIASTCPIELSMGLGPRMAMDCDFTRPPTPHDPEDIKSHPAMDKIGPQSTILGPQSSTIIGGLGITELSLQKIVEGFPLFEYGVVYYNDIFPGSQPHITKFCYQINAYRSDKNEIVPWYGMCSHWNCADDECKSDREAYDREIAAADKAKASPQPQPTTPPASSAQLPPANTPAPSASPPSAAQSK
jgi:hypothetical protein